MEVLDGHRLVDSRLVDGELLEERSDFVVVGKLVAVKEVEDARRVQRRSLVGVDERVVGDEQSEQVERLLVGSLRRFTETPTLDVAEGELDVAPVSNPSIGLGVLRDDVLVDVDDIPDGGVPQRVDHSVQDEQFGEETVVVVTRPWRSVQAVLTDPDNPQAFLRVWHSRR